MIIDKNHSRMQTILRRGEIFEDQYQPRVKEILDNVKSRGDTAIKEYTSLFDKFDLPKNGALVPQVVIDGALDSIPSELKTALEKAAERIAKFHEKQVEKSWFYDDEGLLLGQKISPVDRVGVYVPGGKAAYPSSVLMNVIPARVAGVKEIVMVTPTPGGVYNPTVLAAAKIAGVDKVYTLGGAQAVGALAYGTDTVPKVDKIVGPGNIFVALAKKMVFGLVDIDMIAGPSEILIIADETATPAWVAADMLSQAEHDELASAVAVVTSEKLAKKIEKELYSQLKKLPRREIAEKSLENYSAIIVVDDLEEACRLADQVAPEHLELCVEYPTDILHKINHAGAIFMGHYTPEASGDYFAGPNHVLPTGGSARFFSPLGVYDFIKRSSIIMYSKQTLLQHYPEISLLADSEGLEAHKRSAMLRCGKRK